MEDTRNYERGIPQQGDYATTTNLQVPNDERINQNIAEKYPMGRTQQESNLMRGPQSGGATNLYETQNMIRGHSRQIQRTQTYRKGQN